VNWIWVTSPRETSTVWIIAASPFTNVYLISPRRNDVIERQTVLVCGLSWRCGGERGHSLQPTSIKPFLLCSCSQSGSEATLEACIVHSLVKIHGSLS